MRSVFDTERKPECALSATAHSIGAAVEDERLAVAEPDAVDPEPAAGRDMIVGRRQVVVAAVEEDGL
jgi:hypothetical protein